MSGKREASGKNNKGKAKAILAVLIVAVVIMAIIVVALTHSGSSANQKETSDTESVSSSTSESLENDNSDGEAAESFSDASVDNTESEDDDTEADAEETTAGTIPEVEESSSLTLSSVYTSSILNPDCGGEYAEEIASLEVTNSSDRYLVSATLTATMSDGSEVLFDVFDLPAGATAEIFDTENQTLDSSVTCTSLVCTSEEYIDEDVLMSDTIEVTVSGSDAIITNTGDSTLTGLTVVYHCDMAGQYFGGASYTITVDSLAAGESYTLSDSTLMGEVAVVRIYQ